jgi:outer membrane protein assembly factor BamB
MSKIKSFVLSLFLVLAMLASLMTLPSVNAHDPPLRISTYAFISVEPNPVGVGQTVYINFWIDKVPPTAIGQWGYQWHGMTVKVTDPNGHTETLNMGNSDAAGGTWNSIVVDQIGTYHFEGNFPEQTAKIENPYPYGGSGYVPVGADFINDTYLASSASTTLVVQEQPIETAYPPNPLPTELWTRPVNSMNRNWYSISGNWLGLGAGSFANTGMYDANQNFNPYTEAPGSAHVLWTKPEAFGGQLGGEFGESETGLYASGTAYEPKFAPVILYGILYYTAYPGAANNRGPLTAVDIRTGQTLWTVNADEPLRCGMIYKFDSGDQYGGKAYLFTAPLGGLGEGFVLTPGYLAPKWSMYDAMTGEWILDIANASAGTLVRGENGEILSYTVAGDMLRLWNMSKCIEVGSTKNNIYTVYSAAEIWRPPQGVTLDWNDGYEWNATVATDISGVPIIPGLAISKVVDDVVLLTAQLGGPFAGVPGGAQVGYEVDAGYSAVDGQKLWGPINRTLTPYTNVVLGPAGDGVYTQYTNQMTTWVAYSLDTGHQVWGPTEPFNSSWAYYDFSPKGAIGYGNFYTFGLSGEVYAYDAQTGDLVWSWNAGPAGVDTPYGVWPLGVFGGYVLADGKLYLTAGHDYTPPVFKGAKEYCLNATSGELIWSSLCFSINSAPAVADGVLVKFNGYDNQIYGYGKGPSETTVSASPKISVEGNSIMAEGMVTDISPGTEEYVQTARFPNGVPAISDKDQGAWMEYLYQQQPKPTDATGVEVTISVLDPNGNVYDVATATSDVNGFYSAMFTPPVPGKYTVYATFAGSESYYSSSATTAINVEEAPAATLEPTPIPASTADIYIVPGIIGIIVAIVIVGVILILMIRKR